MATKKKGACCGDHIAAAKKKGAELEKMASAELQKIKKEMDVVAKKAEQYIKKNPTQAAFISAGIGAALGTAVGVLVGGGKKKKK